MKLSSMSISTGIMAVATPCALHELFNTHIALRKFIRVITEIIRHIGTLHLTGVDDLFNCTFTIHDQPFQINKKSGILMISDLQVGPAGFEPATP